MSHTRVFIVHGYTASPHSHWFPWLKARLEARDIRVEVLAMPDPHHPQPAAWDAAMDSLVRDHDERTFLLGHSLGCITILRQLSRLPACPPPAGWAGSCWYPASISRCTPCLSWIPS